MKYKEGDEVIVKVPRTGLGTLPAKIVSKSKTKDNYIVQYDSGVEQDVSEKFIKLSEGISASPRTRSPGRRTRTDPELSTKYVKQLDGIPTSPGVSEKYDKLLKGITASPRARSPGRRSPSRRSPSRTSPSRNASPSRLKSPTSPPRRKSPSRKVSQNDWSDSPILNFPRRRRPIDQVTELSTVNSTSETIITESYETYEKFERESASKELEEPDVRVLHLRQTEKLFSDLEKFSDDDIETSKIFNKQRSEPKIVAPPREFGGWFGTLVAILTFPPLIFAIHLFCNESRCTYTKLPDLKQYNLVSSFVDTKVSIIYGCYLSLMALLTALHFGGKKVESQPSKDTKYVYCMNGLLSSFVAASALVIAEWQDFSVVDYVYEKYFQLLVAAAVYGLLLSIFLFVKSHFVPVSSLNPHAVTYNFIYDYYMGRELNPRILGVDLKMFISRTALIGLQILNSILIFKSLNITMSDEKSLNFENITLEPTLLVAYFLQSVYMLDSLYFEHAMTTTFELQYEGVGYMTAMGYALYPFMGNAPLKYLYEHHVHLPLWQLVLVTIVFLIGYFIYRASNLQKNAFRLKPYDPTFSQMNTIPTSQGKKLLASGYWGIVRHPNYLGDILMHLALACLCICVPASLGILLSVPLLVHRALRDSARCHRRYGPAWDRYCQRVTYYLIPKVF